MSVSEAQTSSNLRLADELADAYEQFAAAIDPFAIALGEALPDERLQLAVEFLEAWAGVHPRFELRWRQAVAHHTVRSEEHAS